MGFEDGSHEHGIPSSETDGVDEALKRAELNDVFWKATFNRPG